MGYLITGIVCLIAGIIIGLKMNGKVFIGSNQTINMTDGEIDD